MFQFQVIYPFVCGQLFGGVIAFQRRHLGFIAHKERFTELKVNLEVHLVLGLVCLFVGQTMCSDHFNWNCAFYDCLFSGT